MKYCAIIRGRIVGQIVAQYSTRPRVEYLYILKRVNCMCSEVSICVLHMKTLYFNDQFSITVDSHPLSITYLIMYLKVRYKVR